MTETQGSVAGPGVAGVSCGALLPPALTQHQRGPALHPGRESFQEDLVQEEKRLRVEEDAIHVLVGAGRLLARRRHLERPQEAGDEQIELLHVLLLGLHHAEHQTGEVHD